MNQEGPGSRSCARQSPAWHGMCVWVSGTMLRCRQRIHSLASASAATVPLHGRYTRGSTNGINQHTLKRGQPGSLPLPGGGGDHGVRGLRGGGGRAMGGLRGGGGRGVWGSVPRVTVVEVKLTSAPKAASSWAQQSQPQRRYASAPAVPAAPGGNVTTREAPMGGRLRAVVVKPGLEASTGIRCSTGACCQLHSCQLGSSEATGCRCAELLAHDSLL